MGHQVKFGLPMKITRKPRVDVPAELLGRVQRAEDQEITHMVRTGPQFVAASQAYAHLRQLRGDVKSSISLNNLKADR
jgi:hypothetical protein